MPAARADRRLGNDMLSRAAGICHAEPHRSFWDLCGMATQKANRSLWGLFATPAPRALMVLSGSLPAVCTGPHVEVMELLLASGAEPSLIDKEGNTVDAPQIVGTYRALASKGSEGEGEGAKDEL